MARLPEPGREHAFRLLRPRRPAGSRGGDDERALSIAPRVVLYHAHDCHLCERARRTLAELRRECEFELEEVDITGDLELEGRYREFLPVVEIDGERAFVYQVSRRAFLRKVAAQSPPQSRP